MKRIIARCSGRTFGSLKILLLLLFLFHAPLAHAALQDMVGRYVGAWTNLTFGSTGKAVIAIQISGTNANLAFDMQGPVFGAGNAPPISMPGTVQGNTILINNKGEGIFGDISGSIDGTTGTFQTTLTNIPGGYIQRVTNNGWITNGVIFVNYSAYFYGAPGPQNPANGVLGAVLVPPIVITNSIRGLETLTLQWSGGKGPFAVQTTSNLTSGVWGNYSSPPTNSAIVPLSSSGNAFFRISGQ